MLTGRRIRENASDVHVIALQLAYIWGRPALVLNTPKPDPLLFAEFVRSARQRSQTVYFLGGGGTDLLSRTSSVDRSAARRFQVPEYESLRNAYPTHVRQKEFDFGIYRFVDPQAPAERHPFDVGTSDDLNVVRFHAKERNGDDSFRWTRPVSYLSCSGSIRARPRWHHDGERRTACGPGAGRRCRCCRTTVHWARSPLALADRRTSFAIPPDLAAAAAQTDEAAVLKLVSSTWNPRASQVRTTIATSVSWIGRHRGATCQDTDVRAPGHLRPARALARRRWLTRL